MGNIDQTEISGKLVLLDDDGSWMDVNAEIISLKQQLTAPTGSIIMFSSATPPTGYLLCNGQSISEYDYPDLFAIIGGNVPDLTDRFVRAQNSNASNILQTAEDTTAPNGLTGIANHSHSFTTYVDGGSDNTIDNLRISMADGYSGKSGTTRVNTGQTSATVAFYGDSETAPKHIIMAFCIKY